MKKQVLKITTLFLVVTFLTACGTSEKKEIKENVMEKETVKKEIEKVEKNETEGAEYRNEEFGFSLMFPISWDGYEVRPVKNVDNAFTFGFVDEDGKLFEGLFEIHAYTKGEWSEQKGLHEKGEIPGGDPEERKLGENDAYIFVKGLRFDVPSEELMDRFDEVSSILDSFKAVN